jgi:hypothetical protein
MYVERDEDNTELDTKSDDTGDRMDNDASKNSNMKKQIWVPGTSTNNKGGVHSTSIKDQSGAFRILPPWSEESEYLSSSNQESTS